MTTRPFATSGEPVDILLVDDQPAKLLSYEVILAELGENLIKAQSAREALGHLLKRDVAVILIDVCMPELDGFELAQMIREHPRFQKTAIIFVSAVMMDEPDRLRGYDAGAVDYVSVPVVAPVLRAKVRVFAELFRKTRELELLNERLEARVEERTAALTASAAQLHKSEQRRSLALAAGQMGSWDWDLRSDFWHWDEGQHRIFGTQVGAEVSLRALQALLHVDDRSALERLAEGGVDEAFQLELRFFRGNDEERCCLFAGAAVFDEAGRVEGFRGITMDITERKNAEKALRLMNDELEARVEARTREREHALAQLFEAQKLDTIGQLTGGVAHDFNNLLQAVSTSLTLLKKTIPPEPRTDQLFEIAIKGTNRGAALTQRLLAFARRQELKPKTVDFRDLFHDLEDLLKRSVGPRVRIVKQFDTTPPLLVVDANQLELALLNLCVNARDAMPSGGRLTVSAVADADWSPADFPKLAPGSRHARIVVSDEGTGMDAATLAKATEPFYTTKGVGKGTGLGLSMVQGLAIQSGGAMRITSELGKGTQVTLLLPRPAENEGATAPSIAPPSMPLSPGCFTVLVVDDDQLVAMGTVASLEVMGHTVYEAHSGEEALAMLAAQPQIELVITDHAMPGMTGLELARTLQIEYPGLAVILATGYAELLPGETELLDLPRLSKPYSPDDLALAIASVHRARP